MGLPFQESPSPPGERAGQGEVVVGVVEPCPPPANIDRRPAVPSPGARRTTSANGRPGAAGSPELMGFESVLWMGPGIPWSRDRTQGGMLPRQTL